MMTNKKAIKSFIGHRSDCAVHNEPAFRNEKCNCGFLKNVINTREAIIQAKRELKNNDPHLANYILRDLQVVKDAKLDDLSWAMHKEGCCDNDVLGLISHIEKYLGTGK